MLRRPVSSFPGKLAFALLLLPLSGCQSQKVIARVNSSVISEEEFTARALRVRGGQLTDVSNLEVGGSTLMQMIREKLTHQLAARNNGAVSEETARTLAEFNKKSLPQVANQINLGLLSDEDLIRKTQTDLEDFHIGTDGAKADAAAIKAKYEQSKDQLKVPETWTIRYIQAPTPELAQQALTMLKGGMSFQDVAKNLLRVTPLQAQVVGQDTAIQVPSLQKNPNAAPLYQALAPLSVNQFVAQPVSITAPTQAGTSQTAYMVAQLVRKDKEFTPTLEQIQPLIEQEILAATRPQWREHAYSELAQFTKNSDIQINIDRYKPLLRTYILPQAETHAIALPGSASPSGAGTTAPSSAGAGTSAPAPSGTGGAGTAPSGGTTAPPPSAGSGAGAPGGQ